MNAVRLVLDVHEEERAALRYTAEEVLRPLGFRLADDDGAPSVGLDDKDVGALREGFRWLSGGVEREVSERDRWGRVPLKSMPESHRVDPLARPVDAARERLGETLRRARMDVTLPTWLGRSWAVCLTHDLDALHTSRLRAFAGDLARGFRNRGIRRAVGPDDRRRSARALAELAEANGHRSTFFVKAGASGPEDVPARPERDSRWFRHLLDAGHEIGLHPSIHASMDPARLDEEARRLARVIGMSPRLVRSHYLRWDAAVTPALYARAGFRADSTLGWSESPGFRRGTAHPFRIWDPTVQRASSLWEVPLAVMDTSLFVHQRLTDEAASERLTDVFEAARHSNGVAVVLWHNCMDGDPAWWRRLRVLESAVRQARRDGAALLTMGQALAAAQMEGRENPRPR